MDNNTHSSYEDGLKELKYRIEILKRKCSIAKEKLEKKTLEIPRLDRDVEKFERELSDYKSKTKTIQELWKDGEIEIEAIKWMEEKASVIFECNSRKNNLQLKTMNIIRQNHSNLTTCAFKTIRQETARKMINNEINNLSDRKKELENKLHRLQKSKIENENYLVKARTELMETKARGETVRRLKKKLIESENSRLNVITKLNDMKTSEFMNIEKYQLPRICPKVE